MADRSILIQAASRPYPGETANGDAWHVDWQETGCRIAVIDGLGHGPGAAEAAHLAREALAGLPDADPLDAIRACHTALRGSRGAAVGIAALDLRRMRATFAGVGNVEARLRNAGRTVRFISLRGIVGAVLPTLRAFDAPLEPGWLLLAHTDGIRDRFDPEPVAPNADALRRHTEQLLAAWARATDDATVLVATAASAPPVR